MEDTPVNRAHAFANAAEEFEEKELWAKAMEAHFRAADQFVLAINYTSDPEVVRTLKLLYATHNRQGKELQRRLEKQAQQSPKQPQERLNTPASHRSRSKSSSATPDKSNSTQRTHQLQSRKGSSSTQPTTYLSSQHALGVQIPSNNNEKMASDLLRSGLNSSVGSNSGIRRSDSTTSMGVSKEIMTTSTAPSISLEGSSSSEKIGESYMVLRGNNDSTDDDDSDPFNKFWGIVETLVSKISNPLTNPVAFATVPLNASEYSRTPFDPNTIHPPLPFGNNVSDVVDELNAAMMESFFIIPKEQRLTGASGGYSHPSSTLSPGTHFSSGRNTSTKTLEEYAMENAQLKSVIDNLSKRMMTYEKAAEENSMLKSSILQFKNDYLQKQAKRIKVSQEMLRSSYVAKPLSPESSTVGSTQSLQKRVKELEEELQLTKAECEKQKTLAVKYKDRLNKIKENARSKKLDKKQDENKSNDPSALPDDV
ncbi:4636_t:CDS:10 [Gigaspora margarita]|uniref:4636_t:CDS:1 n=1 Tax=Gigaspora margarita TaxID=4874 RepID=A0ABN7W350_GIGMA|nr:4636_t:CDS:10 [Gigaspora margarita]